MKFKEKGISANSERINNLINEAISQLKKLDEKKILLEKQVQNLQNDREDCVMDYENKQNYLEDLNRRINEMSIKIKNFNNEREKIKKSKSGKTGNEKLDLLISQKMKMQVFYIFIKFFY